MRAKPSSSVYAKHLLNQNQAPKKSETRTFLKRESAGTEIDGGCGFLSGLRFTDITVQSS